MAQWDSNEEIKSNAAEGGNMKQRILRILLVLLIAIIIAYITTFHPFGG